MFATSLPLWKLSLSPAHRAVEKLYLAFSPVWMAIIAYCMLTHCFATWGDVGHLWARAWAVFAAVADSAFSAVGKRARNPVFAAAQHQVEPVCRADELCAVLFRLGDVFEGLGMQYHFPTTWSLNGTPVFCIW